MFETFLYHVFIGFYWSFIGFTQMRNYPVDKHRRKSSIAWAGIVSIFGPNIPNPDLRPIFWGQPTDKGTPITSCSQVQNHTPKYAVCVAKTPLWGPCSSKFLAGLGLSWMSSSEDCLAGSLLPGSGQTYGRRSSSEACLAGSLLPGSGWRKCRMSGSEDCLAVSLLPGSD